MEELGGSAVLGLVLKVFKKSFRYKRGMDLLPSEPWLTSGPHLLKRKSRRDSWKAWNLIPRKQYLFYKTCTDSLKAARFHLIVLNWDFWNKIAPFQLYKHDSWNSFSSLKENSMNSSKATCLAGQDVADCGRMWHLSEHVWCGNTTYSWRRMGTIPQMTTFTH